MSVEDLAVEIDQAVEEKITEMKDGAVDNEQETVLDSTGATEATETTEEETVGETTETTEVSEVDTTEASRSSTLETVGEVAEADAVEESNIGEASEKPSRISDDVLTRAVQAGIPLADARTFPSEESLAGITARMERQAEEAARAFEEADFREKKEEVTEKKDPFAGLPELDPDTYEPEVIKYFEGLKEIVQQQQETIEGFQGRQDEGLRAFGEANKREVEKWFNGQVAELGEDFTEDLGAGDYASLSRGSLQYANRERLADQVSVLLSGYEAMGQETPPREEVFRSAARLVFADKYQKIYEKKLAEDLEGQASQHIQRAGGQKITHKESPMEEAAREIDEKYFSG